MFTPLFKRMEVFQPYNIKIQPLIISHQEISSKENEKKEIIPEKKIQGFSFDEEHHDTSSTSGGDLEKPEKPIPKNIFKCFLNKKRRNSNLVKCFKCPIEDCETLFETKEELDTHNKLHLEKNIFTCNKCNKQFIQEKNLQKHFKVHCFLVKRYICPYPGCGKKFTALYNQKIHYRIHTGERPYNCNICGKDYYDRANYKYHIKTAHKIKDKNDIICSHGGICHEFKSKKQKIMHHNKLEKECRLEKNNILRLISKYEKTINELKNENEINLEEFNEYKELLEQKEQTGKIIADRDLFDSIFSNKVNL